MYVFLAGSELINRVVSHPNEPVSITAHENRTIRFMDNKTGTCLIWSSVVASWVQPKSSGDEN